MIADDPGAGKTIMAGLIIKELKIRNLVKRILIVAPGHLRDQWRRELTDRFEETFIPVGRFYIDLLFGQNVWLRENQIVTSIDFAKRDDVLKEIDIKVDEEYITQVKQNLGESLATRYIDYTRIKEMEQKAREHRLIPEYTESYFKKAFLKAGGKFKVRNDGFIGIDSIPFAIRNIAEQDLFKKSYGEL